MTDWENEARLLVHEWVVRLIKFGEAKIPKAGFYVFECPELIPFISKVREEAFNKGYKQGVRDEVECINISPEHRDQVYQEAFKAGQREMIEKMLTEIKDHEIRADNGGDYISEDTELMREELFQCVLEIKSQLKSELAEGEE